MKQRDAGYLWDMLQSARDVVEITEGKRFADVQAEKTLRLALERSIEIIGEAASRVSPEVRAAHPEVPWSQIVAQRNVIVHEYGELKYERLWAVATREIPILISLLEPLIPPVLDDPAE